MRALVRPIEIVALFFLSHNRVHGKSVRCTIAASGVHIPGDSADILPSAIISETDCGFGAESRDEVAGFHTVPVGGKKVLRVLELRSGLVA